MMLVRYSGPDEPSLVLLQAKILDLQSQLKQMKKEAKTLRIDYELKCSTSLKSALSSLLTLSDTVCRADKQIVFWYENGKALKVILKPLGVNKKTSAIVERKTAKLRTQVAVVEGQFASTSLICKESLGEVQALNRRVNEYSRTSIGSAQDKVTEVMETFDEKKKRIEIEISEKEFDVYRVNANIDETNQGITRTQAARERAQEAQDTATVVSGPIPVLKF